MKGISGEAVAAQRLGDIAWDTHGRDFSLLWVTGQET